MVIQDKARIIARDTRFLIPSRIRQACQSIIFAKAFPKVFRIRYKDIQTINKIYDIHYLHRHI